MTTMSNELKAKVTLGLGAVLSIPVVRRVNDGTIPIADAAIRVAVAMVFAFAAVSLLAWIIGSYLPKPIEADDAAGQGPASDGIEDAVLVDEHQPPADAP
jgi:glucose dehydrogenase